MISRSCMRASATALSTAPQAVEHSMPLARGMDIPMADQFIGMYVNDFTLDYGDTGRRAIHGVPRPAATKPVSFRRPSQLEFVE